MKTVANINILLTLLLIFTLPLSAEISDEDKVYILTDYLVKEKSKGIDEALKVLTPASPEYKALQKKKQSITVTARNEAIATVYGKPVFENLVYDDDSEMFFGRIVSSKGNFVRDVDFYMPKKRARAFKKKVDAGRIEIEHVFDGNRLEFKDIELEYAGVSYPLHVVYPNSFVLKLGGYFIGTQDTELYTKKNGIGATLNLQELFDMEERISVARVGVSYRFNPKHRIEASWYRINSSSSKQVDTSFDYDGETYAAGAYVNIFLNTDIYKINYVYSAYRTSKLELSFRVGLHITGIKTGLEAGYNLGTVNESYSGDSLSLTAPLPVVGLGLGYEVTSNLFLNYQIDYFALSYDNSVSGSMTDSLLSLDYQFNRYIGVGGGVNRTAMRFKGEVQESTVGLNDEVVGLVGYLVFSY